MPARALRRRPAGWAAGLALLAPWLAGCAAVDDASRPPNVVMLFADDLGWADIGSQGAQGFATPNLDRLAREGARLSDFYAAQPVCSASRAALLTGCYPNRIGISGALGPDARHGLAASELTLAELCRSRGYHTAIFGKWHLGHLPDFLPTRHGFDEFFGIPYSNDMWPRHPETPAAYPPLPLIEGERTVELSPDQTRFTAASTRRAVDFIERHARDRFFLYVPYAMPHVPLHVSAAFAGRSPRGLYGDVIEELDASVGAILDALERSGNARDTLVIFSSDNGPWLSYGDHAGSAGPLREGKGTTFEGGVRVPCLVRWPRRILAGRVLAQPAMMIDILPSVAAAIGAPLPEHAIDGRDLLPLLRGESELPAHEALFFYYHENELEALRCGRWKLHFPHSYRTLVPGPLARDGIPGSYDYGARTGLELYDLESDIGESRNVADEQPQVVADMVKLAAAQRADLGDRLTQTPATGARAAGSFEPANQR